MDFNIFLTENNLMFDVLIKCPLFVGLDADEIEELFLTTHHQLKNYKPNQLIALSGEKITNQLIVITGSVRGEMIDFNGKTIKIEDIPAPRPLAPAFLFGKNNHYPVNIVVNENSRILFIPKSSFVQMMQLNESVLNNFMNIISNRAQFLSNKIKFLSFQSIKGKLAHYILQRLEEIDSDTIILDKSQSQLAELFGVTRPSLARAIREMDRVGVIQARAKKIRIINREKLSTFLN